jgi:hypothetical protein
MGMKKVVVHIDRLVLKGFDPRDQNRIAADLQAELARAMADPPAHERLADLGQVPHIWAEADMTGVHGTTASPGTSAAQAIMRGLKR